MSRLEGPPTAAERQAAREYVQQLPDDKRRLFSTWAYAQRITHLGTDFYGNRLTPREREVWEHVIEATEQRMVEQFSLNTHMDALPRFFKEHHVHDLAYREAYVDAYSEGQNPTSSYP